mmetsp:Transcript_28747/g.68150  ORF Transcript_28747/g.68150 Transcript_28747/m.68150 type:complete len:217 (-) Transcript_28747:4737-5387(-)
MLQKHSCPPPLRPALEEAQRAVLESEEEVGQDFVFGLELLDGVADFHVGLDDDGEEKVEHEEELDDVGKRDVDDEQRVLGEALGQAAQQDFKLGAHGRVDSLELRARAKAPVGDERGEAEDEHEEDKKVPDVVHASANRADQHACTRVDGRGVDDPDEHEDHDEKPGVLEALLLAQQPPHRLHGREKRVDLVLHRLGAVPERNLDEVGDQLLCVLL